MDVTPFTMNVPDDILTDLRARLAQTRWPGELPDTGWEYGSNLAYIQELVEYWRTQFDWRAQERMLNELPHFRTQIDGLGIHFIHVRGKGPHPHPLVITHGWPSTFFEILKIIPRLTDPASYGGDPADAFDVVVPSLPGYGFSDHTRERGMSVFRVADLWTQLMAGLGYTRYGAQGGDWGASVTARLGFIDAEHVSGIHTTSVASGTIRPYLGPGARPLSEAEKRLLEEREAWQRAEGGYAHIQGTKPQTLSYGLNDSPAGLCAWIVEKFRTWSDCGGDVESVYTKDELLTTVTIYWVTQTINSSTRIYFESQRHPWEMQQNDRINVPCAVALFPKDLSHPPREWGERGYNVQRWTEMPRGGHFAAMEEPDMLVEDIRAFFRTVR
jgi:pimeloyl-ACP methyl ester carboxylesterase